MTVPVSPASAGSGEGRKPLAIRVGEVADRWPHRMCVPATLGNGLSRGGGRVLGEARGLCTVVVGRMLRNLAPILDEKERR